MRRLFYKIMRTEVFLFVKTFESVQNLHDFAWADLDEDGDGDVVTLNPEGKIRFFTNERGGLF